MLLVDVVKAESSSLIRELEVSIYHEYNQRGRILTYSAVKLTHSKCS